jgi:hypothetical protein
MYSTLTGAHVQQHTAALLRSQLRLTDFSPRCTATTLLAVVFSACCRLVSVYAVARGRGRAPSHETVRQALHTNLPDLDELGRRLNRALAFDLPKHLRRRQRLAIDLTLIPYHGRPARAADELYRSEAKGGTSHFHAYATAYLILRGQRFTLALSYVRQGERLQDVLRRLLRRCAQIGVRPRLLLLDRGFWTVEVIRYLQAARYPFLMPVIARGPKADGRRGPGGTRAFYHWARSGWGRHTLRRRQGGRTATVAIAVYVRNRRGRRGRHGRERLVYASWGWRPSSPAAAHEAYRARFGVESSYRQLNQARARTCSRRPDVRLFLVGVALVLRNVWVWLHYAVLSAPRRGGRVYHWERLRLKDLLLLLHREAERILGTGEGILTERPIPIDVNKTKHRKAS